MSCTLKKLPSLLDAQFDTLRKVAIQDLSRREKENHAGYYSSTIPFVSTKRTNEYVLSKMHITVWIHMESHKFKLFDHDSPNSEEQSVILAARVKIDPKNEKVENVVIECLKTCRFDDAFINGTWYSSNPGLSYSKILAGRYRQKPKSDSKTTTS